MSGVQELRLVDDIEPSAAVEAAAPRVFVRVISTPPGMPWDQLRAARLEARMGAPIPLDGVVYELMRLAAWRSREAGRFAAFYVRSQEVRGRLTTEVEVDGRPIRVSFLSPAEQAHARRRAGVLAGALAAAALVVLGALFLALQTHAAASSRLEALEARSGAELHQARKLAQLKDQARALDQAHMRGRSLTQALDDLALASAAKAPDARIQGFHWDRGYAAVEVRGDSAPLAGLQDRLQKSARPLRPGVWLWVLAPASSSAAQRSRTATP